MEKVFPPIGDSKFFAGIAAGMVEEFALSSGKLDNVRVWFNNKVSCPGSVAQFTKVAFVASIKK